jgi:hypothetical protein
MRVPGWSKGGAGWSNNVVLHPHPQRGQGVGVERSTTLPRGGAKSWEIERATECDFTDSIALRIGYFLIRNASSF